MAPGRTAARKRRRSFFRAGLRRSEVLANLLLQPRRAAVAPVTLHEQRNLHGVTSANAAPPAERRIGSGRWDAFGLPFPCLPDSA